MVTRRVEINGNARTREILLSSSEILGICNISVYKCLFSLRATQMRTSIITSMFIRIPRNATRAINIANVILVKQHASIFIMEIARQYLQFVILCGFSTIFRLINKSSVYNFQVHKYSDCSFSYTILILLN